MRITPLAITAAAVAFLAAAPSPPIIAGARPDRITGTVTHHGVAKGETLVGIGARMGVDVATLAADNGLPGNAVLRAGQVIRIDNRHLVPAAVRPGVIVINVPQRMLFYEWEGSVAGMPVAVGRPDWRTPVLPFTVRSREVDPAWDVPASIREEARRAGRVLPAVVPPGPNNPLGRFWLGLTLPGIGIHGTNAPASIYRAATHGCIRVGPDDIAWLFPRVALGTPGEIIYEPILLGAVDGEIFVEVHSDVYRRLQGDPREAVRLRAAEAGLTGDIDWVLADAVVAARHGVARAVGGRKIPHRGGVFPQ